jgi:outer membrane receptor protein involved in Fe transport
MMRRIALLAGVLLARQPLGAQVDTTRADSSRKLPTLTVTATRRMIDVLHSPLPVTGLTTEMIRRANSVSLSHAIEQLAGIRTLSTGAQIGKPVIRGLFGPRVLVMENGNRMEDYSWSSEDGPSIDTRLASRVEVIRGPASVLYGSDAIGGVVNALSADLPFVNGGHSLIRVGLEGYGAMGTREGGGAAKIEGGSGRFAWRLAGVGRMSEAIQTPEGEVEHSGFESFNGEGAFGFQHGNGSTVLRYARYGGEFKLLEANGPPPGEEEGEEEEEGPERLTSDSRLQLTNNHLFGSMRFETKLQWQRHSLIEKSDDAALIPQGNITLRRTVVGRPVIRAAEEEHEATAFDLLLNTYTVDLLGHHALNEQVHGVVGVSGLYQKNDSKGPILLIPGAKSTGGAGFLFEEADLGTVSLLGGVRYDSRKVEPDGVNPSRTFSAFTGDVGMVVRPVPGVALTGNVGRAYRVPTLFELFTSGFLPSEQRFELGDPDLDPETSLNLDGGLRWEHAMGTMMWHGEISAYRNKINHYIYVVPVQTVPAQFPTVQYSQTTGVLTGAEAAVALDPIPVLTLTGRYDMVKGTNDETNDPLPLIPPSRVGFEAELHSATTRLGQNAYLNVGVNHTAKKTRLSSAEVVIPDAQYDVLTDAYTLVNMEAGITHDIHGHPFRIDFRVLNIGDVAYRDFLSRYKQFALNPGRDIQVRLSTGM